MTLFNAQAYTDTLTSKAHLETNADTELVTRQSHLPLKAVGEGRVGGYLVVWGSPAQKDLHGEYFTPETDFALDWYQQRPALYHHGLDGVMQITAIGTIDTIKADNVGLWAEMQLNLRKRYVDQVMELVNAGKLNWSSGSLGHLVEVGSDGWIKRWPIVEGSATPSPAEPRKTNIVPLKFNAFKSALTELTEPLLEAVDGNRAAPVESSAGGGKATLTGKQTSTRKGMLMDEQMLLQIIMATAEMLGAQITPEQAAEILAQVAPPAEEAMAAIPAGTSPTEAGKMLAGNAGLTQAVKAAITAQTMKANPGDVANAFKAALMAQPGKPKAAPFHAPVTANEPPAQPEPAIHVKSAFDDLSADDMLYGYMMMKNRKGFNGASEQYSNALAEKVHKTGRTAAKANELSHSTQSSYGDEWVPDLWSSELWRKVRLDNKILPLFRTVDMPSNPFELPIEGTDPTVYFVPETTAESELLLSGSGSVIPDSKVGTGKVQISAKKLALRVGFSAELTEDSIIPVTTIYREQAERAIMDAIDHVLLNGDTETGATGNINSDDGAPAATAKYLAMNGLLKAALVTDTTRKLDASGVAPTLSLIRSMRFKMASQYSTRIDNLAYIVGAEVYAKLLGLNEFLTMDKVGNDATVLTGQIGMIDGIPVVLSAELAQAEADGKINTASPSSTLFGRMAIVNRQTWYVGYRRRVALSVDYLPYFDSYQMSATVRFGFINQNTQGIAVLYDLAT